MSINSANVLSLVYKHILLNKIKNKCYAYLCVNNVEYNISIV
jgi:hypothetical protein